MNWSLHTKTALRFSIQVKFFQVKCLPQLHLSTFLHLKNIETTPSLNVLFIESWITNTMFLILCLFPIWDSQIRCHRTDCFRAEVLSEWRMVMRNDSYGDLITTGLVKLFFANLSIEIQMMFQGCFCVHLQLTCMWVVFFILKLDLFNRIRRIWL